MIPIDISAKDLGRIPTIPNSEHTSRVTIRKRASLVVPTFDPILRLVFHLVAGTLGATLSSFSSRCRLQLADKQVFHRGVELVCVV